MTRRKRSYIPKAKGCHECSQRRINCDRGQPQCAKCVASGIQCSGLGIRYRFNEDVISKRIAIMRNARRHETVPCLSPDCNDMRNGLAGADKAEPPTEVEPYLSDADDSLMIPPRHADHKSNLNSEDSQDANANQQLLMVFFDAASALTDTCEDTTLSWRRNLSVSEPWKVYLLDHFSRKIASEMAIIDSRDNGWRCLVLPAAHLDDLVMDAVLSASAFHFAANVGSNLYNSCSFYARAIHKLQQRQDLTTSGQDGRHFILLALLVLLVTVLVNGYSDFPLILKLLESALVASGGEEELSKGELGQFLKRQIRKFRGYAAPLLSQPEGLARLSMKVSNGYDDQYYYQETHPCHSTSISMLFDIQYQACEIYTRRAIAGATAPASTALVEHFKNSLENVPSNFPCQHVLVWPTFMAACESATPDHRQFFTDVLLAHHKRNGFGNIPRVLSYLRKIWARSAQESWTMLIPKPRVFIV